MEISKLRYFNAICTYQTVSAAAEYLHISQPSLSNAIKELENEFGTQLFRRHHFGMALTPEGEELFKMSKDLISCAEHIQNVMKDLGREKKVLHLGVPPMIGYLIFSDIYRGFITEYPDNKLEITEGGRNELIQKLSDNYIDMMFLPHNRSIDKNLATQKLMQLEIVCCASKNNPVSKIRAMRPMDLANIPLVLFKNSFFQTEKIKKWFAADNITPRILLQTEQLSTMQSVISNNIAVGFMFKQLVEERSDLVIIPLKIPMLVDVSLVWKKDAYTFKSMKDFREYIAKKFNILCQNNMHVN